MHLLSAEFKTVGSLLECAEREVAGKTNLNDGEISEIGERLSYFGFHFADEAILKARRLRDRSEIEEKLLKVKSANRVSFAEAKRILKGQFDLFLGFRQARAAYARIAWRNAAVVRNIGLARKAASMFMPDLARRQSRLECFCVDFDDLCQEGAIGLMRGVSSYDFTMGFTPSTYLLWWVKQGIRRFLDDMSGTPVYIQADLGKIRTAHYELVNEGKGNPTVEDLARKTRFSAPKVQSLLQLIRVGSVVSPISLDGPSELESDEAGSELGDLTPSDFPERSEGYAEAERNLALKRKIREILSVSTLLPSEREVLIHRFGLGVDQEEHTLEALGEKYGVTRERIRQREEKALEQLRTKEIWEQVRALEVKVLPPTGAISKALWLDAVECWKYLLEAGASSWSENSVLKAIGEFFDCHPSKILKGTLQGRAAVACYLFAAFSVFELKKSSHDLAQLLGFLLLRVNKMLQEFTFQFERLGVSIVPGELTPFSSRGEDGRDSAAMPFYLSPTERREKIQQVFLEVSETRGVLSAMLRKEGGRVKRIVEARFEAAYLLRTRLHLSFPVIAREMGWKDHISAIHAFRKAAARKFASLKEGLNPVP
jgi:RNA polymerase sigma factor (sigma-70 family)